MAHRRNALLWQFFFLLCFDICDGHFAVPLKLYLGKFNFSRDVDLTPLQRTPAGGSGLSLASDPLGIVNFLAMVNNLEGDSGRGYYIEMAIGTPAQKVMVCSSPFTVMSSLWSKVAVFCYWCKRGNAENVDNFRLCFIGIVFNLLYTIITIFLMDLMHL